MGEHKSKDPVDIEKMPAEKANKMKVLLVEDRAKYAFEIAQHRMAIAQLEAAIAKTDVILADLDRKVVGVDYPTPPTGVDCPPPTEAKPQMGTPVGGAEKK